MSGGESNNVFSAYAAHVELDNATKQHFWVGHSWTNSRYSYWRKIFIGGDLNRHVGIYNVGFERVCGECSLEDRNEEENVV